MSPLILNYFLAWRPLGYSVIFFGMILEGEIILYASAFFTHLGFFDFNFFLLYSLAGLILGDIFWYLLGQKAKTTFFLYRWSDRIAKPLDAYLKERPLRTILISKFAYGLCHMTSFRIGAIGIPFGNYLKNDLAASIFWFVAVAGLGYGTSASLLLFKHYLKYAEVIGGLVIAILLGLEYFARHHLGNHDIEDLI